MSYILDALKKSEEERKKGDVPGLQTYTPTAEPSSGNKTWMIGIAVLVTTNIIGLVLWAPWQASNAPVQTNAQPKDQGNGNGTPIHAIPIPSIPVQPVVHQRAVEEKPAVKTTVKPIVEPIIRPVSKSVAKPIVKSVVKSPNTYKAEPTPTPKEEYRSKVPPSTAYLPQLSELPQSIQAQIPDLTFSSHMYSSQDRFRSITINGKRLKQGRYYNEKLYVNEITEKGAIMGFESTLFEVDVLGQWGN